MKIAIIGAGLSGLALARLLHSQAEVVIFEKARGVSGRMSTRRAEPYFFDHGAQYFTIRTDAFQDFMAPLIDKGIVAPWHARYTKIDGKTGRYDTIKISEEPRYVGVPSMNAIAKFLAQGLSIHINTQVTELIKKDKWQLTDVSGEVYNDFDWVVSTAPAPQTGALFPNDFEFHSHIRAVQMRGCFSLMLGFEKPLSLDFDAAHVTNANIAWVAVDSHKPDRSAPYTLMLHSTPDYADAHIDEDRERVMQDMIAETGRLLGCDLGQADYKTIHGWRYASNGNEASQPTYIDSTMSLAACGDWCMGGRVEGAFSSALMLAEWMKKTIL